MTLQDSGLPECPNFNTDLMCNERWICHMGEFESCMYSVSGLSLIRQGPIVYNEYDKKDYRKCNLQHLDHATYEHEKEKMEGWNTDDVGWPWTQQVKAIKSVSIFGEHELSVFHPVWCKMISTRVNRLEGIAERSQF